MRRRDPLSGFGRALVRAYKGHALLRQHCAGVSSNWEGVAAGHVMNTESGQ